MADIYRAEEIMDKEWRKRERDYERSIDNKFNECNYSTIYRTIRS